MDFKSLSCGPELGIFPMAGKAARDGAELERESQWQTRLARGGKAAEEDLREEVEALSWCGGE